MAERLTFVTLGRQRLSELLEDIVLGELKNLSLDSTDEERTAFVVIALMNRGRFEQIEDHQMQQ